jgi:hypothetical protein
MVLLMDNAPYHHKRAMGNSTNKVKKDLVKLYVKYKIKSNNVECNDTRVNAYATYNANKDMVKFHDNTI